MEKVQSYKPANGAASEARVLFLGPVGAGKSSFISSVQSVFSGRVLNRAMVGSSSSASFTKRLQSFAIRRSGEKSDPTALVLCDIMGLGDGDLTGLSLYDVLCVIKGHVTEGHEFKAEEPVRSDSMSFRKKPNLKDKIHCVVFVVDALKINSYTKGLSTTFQQLRENISSLDVHQVALLTHVDEVCTYTAQDVSQVYRSSQVQKLILKAGSLLGMATSYILPVRNYSSQLELQDNMDILLLNAVDHILQYADLYFQDHTTVVLSLLMRSIGNKNTILLGLGFQILQLAWYGFGSEPWMMWAAGAVAAMSSITFPAVSALVSRTADPEQQGVGQGMITGIRGLCNGLGPALYGFIFYIFHVELDEVPDGGEDVESHTQLHQQSAIIPGPPFLFGACSVLLALLVALFIPEHTPVGSRAGSWKKHTLAHGHQHSAQPVEAKEPLLQDTNV
ncbi:Hippocampus abundant transcript 1 protein [Bagarius yarrelli]|uniref:Hippocampus abundant transcript 1 protein n=1 Tax=Bagarius yarrelli TaxID=175774 RepID=A0A556TSC0_BAGYA|nr:Hippocampus abundant transcript 1 protein [Bagarius yarrelli]